MRPTTLLPCRHEAAVLTAARRGTLRDDLAAHAAACATCDGAALAGAALRQAAAAYAAEARPPDPALLLRRAAEQRRRFATERAMRPLRLARGAAGAAAAGVLVALAPRFVPLLAPRSIAALLRPPVLPPWRELLPLGGAPGMVAMAALLLTALIAALWLHWEQA